jgi:hypothetical protein
MSHPKSSLSSHQSQDSNQPLSPRTSASQPLLASTLLSTLHTHSNIDKSSLPIDQNGCSTTTTTTTTASNLTDTKQPLSAVPSSLLAQYSADVRQLSTLSNLMMIPRSPSSSAASFTESAESDSVHSTTSKSTEANPFLMTDIDSSSLPLSVDTTTFSALPIISSPRISHRIVNDTNSPALELSSALIFTEEPDEYGIIHFAAGHIGTRSQKDLGNLEFEFPPLHVETHAALTQCFITYLDLKSVQALASTSKTLRDIVLLMAAAPMQVTVHKPSAPLDSTLGSPCELLFKRWGKFFSGLTLHRAPMVEKDTLPELLTLTPNLRKLNVHDLDSSRWNDSLMAKTLLRSVPNVEELRLHCSDLVAYDISPYTHVVQSLSDHQGGALRFLKKLTLFTRLDANGSAALTTFLNTSSLSRHLIKLKLSTTLISSPGGNDVLAAVGTHGHIQKLTIMRPEGMGEPIRKSQCAILAQVMVQNKNLFSIHLRRAGMWTDTLAALVPARPTPNIRNIKLDSNSLAYLSAAFFSEAMDNLLSRLPNLESLHLGNNQIDSVQAVALAASLTRHKVDKLCNLTLGSNDIGDAGLRAICKALPTSMKQLYLHGCDIHDEGLESLREALERMPDVWGLGLNGNPISDLGVPILARAIRGRSSLRDIGITLSDVTDIGITQLADSISTCNHLRFIYLYTSGFKAATKITEFGKAYLRGQLPRFATAAFDHKLSRYLKTPE